MENLDKIRYKTKKLLRTGIPMQEQFNEALPMCKQLWEAFSDTNNFWDAWQYAFCLWKINKLKEAEVVCELAYSFSKDKSLNEQQKSGLKYLTSLYSRIINDKYFKYIKKELTPEETNTLLEKVQLLGNLVEHEPSNKTPLEYCSFRAIHAAKKNLTKFPVEIVLDILNKLKVDYLSTSTYGITLDNGKRIEMQSNQEAYFAYKSKALILLKKYEECLECCNKAFEIVEHFHFGNEFWLEDRLLNCITNLGNISEAIIRAEKLALQKDSWFLLYELGRLYLKSKRYEDALLTLIRAAYTKDPFKMKVGLLEDIGDIFVIQGNIELAQMHYLAVKQIREENGWQIPYKLKNKIQSDKIINLNDLKNEWLKYIYSVLKVQNGKIFSLFPNGKAGKISYANGLIYFSARNFFGRHHDLKPNVNVQFVVTISFDHKKNCVSQEANYITYLS